MAIFKTVFKKGEGTYLAKIKFDKEEGDIWADTTKAVFTFAQKTFSDGEEVDVEYQQDEGTGKYTVSKIMKKNGSKGTSKKTSDTPKENSYKEDKKYYGESPTKALAIRKQCALKCAVKSVSILQGHYGDIGTIYDQVKVLYDKFNQLLS